MKTFEVRAPDGRTLRHQAENEVALRKTLVPGYTIVGEAFAEAKEGHVTLSADGKRALLSALLDECGAELLLAWLAKHKIGARK